MRSALQPGLAVRWFFRLSVFLLILVAAPWAIALGIGLTDGERYHSFVIGWAHGDESVHVATVYPDGYVRAHVLRPNLSRHKGLFMKRSRIGDRRRFALASIWPRSISVGPHVYYVMHMSVPVVPLAIPVVTIPLYFRLRLRRRRKRDCCLACGYSLQGAVSNLCSECGLAFDQPVDSTTRSH